MESRSAHETQDSPNFWVVQAEDTEFWDAYIATRPNYNADFYREIYDYHGRHSRSWAMAHDVGCGAGQVTGELSTRFSLVVASDVNGAHVEVARRRLASRKSLRTGKMAEAQGDAKVQFACLSGEDLAAGFPPQSADLIAIAEAMPLMDETKALKGFAGLLRPGGTLAAWFYGRPTFANASMRYEAQPILDEIMARCWYLAFRGSGPDRLGGLKKAADGMASWFDYLAFDPAIWKDVQRIKWNPDATLPFFDGRCADIIVEPKNNVRSEEKTIERYDPTWWQNTWSCRMLRDYFRVLYPSFRGILAEDEVVIKLFEEHEKKMHAFGPTCAFTWPVVLVLATRV